MAISFVGSYAATHLSTSIQNIALSNLKDASNATPTLQAGDLVLVAANNAGTTNMADGTLNPSGYTGIFVPNLYANDSNDTNFQVSYKFMGATPDTTVGIRASTSTTNGFAYAIYVFRGVDTTTPFDVGATSITGTNTGVANAPAITPVTVGSWVVAFGAAGTATGAQFTNPTGASTVTNHFRSAWVATTVDAAVAGALYPSWTSGTVDPAAFGGSTSTNTGSWAAGTIALRPIGALQDLSFAGDPTMQNNPYGWVGETTSDAGSTPVGQVAYFLSHGGSGTGTSTFSIGSTNTGGGRFTFDANSPPFVVTVPGAAFNFATEPTVLLDLVETNSSFPNSPHTSTVTVKVKKLFTTSAQTVAYSDAETSSLTMTVSGTAVTGPTSSTTSGQAICDVGYSGSSTAKVYFEAKLTARNSGTGSDALRSVGVASSTIQVVSVAAAGSLGTPVGFSVTGAGVVRHDTIDDATGASWTSTALNDVIMVAVDFGNKKFWFGKNGTWSNGTPVTASGGWSWTTTMRDFFAYVETYGNTDTWTMNFGATAFSFTQPTGYQAYNAGDPSAGGGGGTTPTRRKPRMINLPYV